MANVIRYRVWREKICSLIHSLEDAVFIRTFESGLCKGREKDVGRGILLAELER